MSNMIDHLTTTILHCMTNAPTPEAGARLAAYRVTDELRKAMTGGDVVTEAVDAIGYAILTGQHYVDMHTGITAAWDAVIGETDE